MVLVIDDRLRQSVSMCGAADRQMALVTVVSPEGLIPAGHPIRRVRVVVDAVLAELDGGLAAMYAQTGRPSVPPERLLKATVLMALYSVRSERALWERLNYDLLFKWCWVCRSRRRSMRPLRQELGASAGA